MAHGLESDTGGWGWGVPLEFPVVGNDGYAGKVVSADGVRTSQAKQTQRFSGLGSNFHKPE